MVTMGIVLLGQSNATFDPAASFSTFNFANPPRRDVVLLPAGEDITIACKPDNPGAWLMHCHVAWHASAGRPTYVSWGLSAARTPRICVWQHVLMTV